MFTLSRVFAGLAVISLAVFGLAGCTTISALMAEPPLTRAELNGLVAAAGCEVTPITARTDTTTTLDEYDCLGVNRPEVPYYAPQSHGPYRATGQRVDYYGLFYRRSDYRVGLDVTVVSDDFDGYLVLLDKLGRVVGQNDDGGGGLHPRLRLFVNEGSYIVAVTSRRPGETGTYRLRVGVATSSE